MDSRQLLGAAVSSWIRFGLLIVLALSTTSRPSSAQPGIDQHDGNSRTDTKLTFTRDYPREVPRGIPLEEKLRLQQSNVDLLAQEMSWLQKEAKTTPTGDLAEYIRRLGFRYGGLGLSGGLFIYENPTQKNLQDARTTISTHLERELKERQSAVAALEIQIGARGRKIDCTKTLSGDENFVRIVGKDAIAKSDWSGLVKQDDREKQRKLIADLGELLGETLRKCPASGRRVDDMKSFLSGLAKALTGAPDPEFTVPLRALATSGPKLLQMESPAMRKAIATQFDVRGDDPDAWQGYSLSTDLRALVTNLAKGVPISRDSRRFTALFGGQTGEEFLSLLFLRNHDNRFLREKIEEARGRDSYSGWQIDIDGPGYSSTFELAARLHYGDSPEILKSLKFEGDPGARADTRKYLADMVMDTKKHNAPERGAYLDLLRKLDPAETGTKAKTALEYEKLLIAEQNLATEALRKWCDRDMDLDVRYLARFMARPPLSSGLSPEERIALMQLSRPARVWLLTRAEEAAKKNDETAIREIAKQIRQPVEGKLLAQLDTQSADWFFEKAAGGQDYQDFLGQRFSSTNYRHIIINRHKLSPVNGKQVATLREEARDAVIGRIFYYLRTSGMPDMFSGRSDVTQFSCMYPRTLDALVLMVADIDQWKMTPSQVLVDLEKLRRGDRAGLTAAFRHFIEELETRHGTNSEWLLRVVTEAKQRAGKDVSAEERTKFLKENKLTPAEVDKLAALWSTGSSKIKGGYLFGHLDPKAKQELLANPTSAAIDFYSRLYLDFDLHDPAAAKDETAKNKLHGTNEALLKKAIERVLAPNGLTHDDLVPFAKYYKDKTGVDLMLKVEPRREHGKTKLKAAGRQDIDIGEGARRRILAEELFKKSYDKLTNHELTFVEDIADQRDKLTLLRLLLEDLTGVRKAAMPVLIKQMQTQYKRDFPKLEKAHFDSLGALPEQELAILLAMQGKLLPKEFQDVLLKLVPAEKAVENLRESYAKIDSFFAEDLENGRRSPYLEQLVASQVSRLLLSDPGLRMRFNTPEGQRYLTVRAQEAATLAREHELRAVTMSDPVLDLSYQQGFHQDLAITLRDEQRKIDAHTEIPRIVAANHALGETKVPPHEGYFGSISTLQNLDVAEFEKLMASSAVTPMEVFQIALKIEALLKATKTTPPRVYNKLEKFHDHLLKKEAPQPGVIHCIKERRNVKECEERYKSLSNELLAFTTDAKGIRFVNEQVDRDSIPDRIRKMSDQELLDWSLWLHLRFKDAKRPPRPDENDLYRGPLYGDDIKGKDGQFIARADTSRRWEDQGFLPQRIINGELMRRIEGKGATPFFKAGPPFTPEFNWEHILADSDTKRDDKAGAALQNLLPEENLPVLKDAINNPKAWFDWADERKNLFVANGVIVPAGPNNPFIYDMTYTQFQILSGYVHKMYREADGSTEVRHRVEELTSKGNLAQSTPNQLLALHQAINRVLPRRLQENATNLPKLPPYAHSATEKKADEFIAKLGDDQKLAIATAYSSWSVNKIGPAPVPKIFAEAAAQHIRFPPRLLEHRRELALSGALASGEKAPLKEQVTNLDSLSPQQLAADWRAFKLGLHDPTPYDRNKVEKDVKEVPDRVKRNQLWKGYAPESIRPYVLSQLGAMREALKKGEKPKIDIEKHSTGLKDGEIYLAALLEDDGQDIEALLQAELQLFTSTTKKGTVNRGMLQHLQTQYRTKLSHLRLGYSIQISSWFPPMEPNDPRRPTIALGIANILRAIDQALVPQELQNDLPLILKALPVTFAAVPDINTYYAMLGRTLKGAHREDFDAFKKERVRRGTNFNYRHSETFGQMIDHDFWVGIPTEVELRLMHMNPYVVQMLYAMDARRLDNGDFKDHKGEKLEGRQKQRAYIEKLLYSGDSDAILQASLADPVLSKAFLADLEKNMNWSPILRLSPLLKTPQDVLSRVADLGKVSLADREELRRWVYRSLEATQAPDEVSRSTAHGLALIMQMLDRHNHRIETGKESAAEIIKQAVTNNAVYRPESLLTTLKAEFESLEKLEKLAEGKGPEGHEAKGRLASYRRILEYSDHAGKGKALHSVSRLRLLGMEDVEWEMLNRLTRLTPEIKGKGQQFTQERIDEMIHTADIEAVRVMSRLWDPHFFSYISQSHFREKLYRDLVEDLLKRPDGTHSEEALRKLTQLINLETQVKILPEVMSSIVSSPPLAIQSVAKQKSTELFNAERPAMASRVTEEIRRMAATQRLEAAAKALGHPKLDARTLGDLSDPKSLMSQFTNDAHFKAIIAPLQTPDVLKAYDATVQSIMKSYYEPKSDKQKNLVAPYFQLAHEELKKENKEFDSLTKEKQKEHIDARVSSSLRHRQSLQRFLSSATVDSILRQNLREKMGPFAAAYHDGIEAFWRAHLFSKANADYAKLDEAGRKTWLIAEAQTHLKDLTPPDEAADPARQSVLNFLINHLQQNPLPTFLAQIYAAHHGDNLKLESKEDLARKASVEEQAKSAQEQMRRLTAFGGALKRDLDIHKKTLALTQGSIERVEAMIEGKKKEAEARHASFNEKTDAPTLVKQRDDLKANIPQYEAKIKELETKVTAVNDDVRKGTQKLLQSNSQALLMAFEKDVEQIRQHGEHAQNLYSAAASHYLKHAGIFTTKDRPGVFPAQADTALRLPSAEIAMGMAGKSLVEYRKLMDRGKQLAKSLQIPGKDRKTGQPNPQDAQEMRLINGWLDDMVSPDRLFQLHPDPATARSRAHAMFLSWFLEEYQSQQRRDTQLAGMSKFFDDTLLELPNGTQVKSQIYHTGAHWTLDTANLQAIDHALKTGRPPGFKAKWDTAGKFNFDGKNLSEALKELTEAKQELASHADIFAVNKTHAAKGKWSEDGKRVYEYVPTAPYQARIAAILNDVRDCESKFRGRIDKHLERVNRSSLAVWNWGEKFSEKEVGELQACFQQNMKGWAELRTMGGIMYHDDPAREGKMNVNPMYNRYPTDVASEDIAFDVLLTIFEMEVGRLDGHDLAIADLNATLREEAAWAIIELASLGYARFARWGFRGIRALAKATQIVQNTRRVLIVGKYGIRTAKGLLDGAKSFARIHVGGGIANQQWQGVRNEVNTKYGGFGEFFKGLAGWWNGDLSKIEQERAAMYKKHFDSHSKGPHPVDPRIDLNGNWIPDYYETGEMPAIVTNASKGERDFWKGMSIFAAASPLRTLLSFVAPEWIAGTLSFGASAAVNEYLFTGDLYETAKHGARSTLYAGHWEAILGPLKGNYALALIANVLSNTMIDLGFAGLDRQHQAEKNKLQKDGYQLPIEQEALDIVATGIAMNLWFGHHGAIRGRHNWIAGQARHVGLPGQPRTIAELLQSPTFVRRRVTEQEVKQALGRLSVNQIRSLHSRFASDPVELAKFRQLTLGDIPWDRLATIRFGNRPLDEALADIRFDEGIRLFEQQRAGTLTMNEFLTSMRWAGQDALAVVDHAALLRQYDKANDAHFEYAKELATYLGIVSPEPSIVTTNVGDIAGAAVTARPGLGGLLPWRTVTEAREVIRRFRTNLGQRQALAHDFEVARFATFVHELDGLATTSPTQIRSLFVEADRSNTALAQLIRGNRVSRTAAEYIFGDDRVRAAVGP